MKSNFYPIVGLLIFAIPFLGIPIAWKGCILSFLGLVIFIYSIWPSVNKKLFQKPNLSKTE